MPKPWVFQGHNTQILWSLFLTSMMGAISLSAYRITVKAHVFTRGFVCAGYIAVSA